MHGPNLLIPYNSKKPQNPHTNTHIIHLSLVLVLYRRKEVGKCVEYVKSYLFVVDLHASGLDSVLYLKMKKRDRYDLSPYISLDPRDAAMGIECCPIEFGLLDQ